MKRWALVVAGLYFLMFAMLTAPMVALAFAPQVKLPEVANVYAAWPYWLWLVIMVGSQFALLAVPVQVASRRPVTRRSLWPTVVAGGFMMGGLAAGAVSSLSEFFFRDQGNGNWIGAGALSLAGLTWCLWTVVFLRTSRSRSPEDLISRTSRWLLRGSILELLIAVPTHIVARYRDYCCAGFMTFVGLTMGVSVMLFSFGPAVLLLYAGRWRRLHPVPPINPNV